MAEISLIAAMDLNRGIGFNNELPWHISQDLKHFKRTTHQHPIVMGRKTYESIGRPLPYRENIVVTRNTNWRAEGVTVFHSVEQVLEHLRNESKKTYVIGGAEIYEQFFPHATGMCLTEIKKKFKCDAFFPEFDKSKWEVTSLIQNYSLDCECHFDYVEYKRIE